MCAFSYMCKSQPSVWTHPSISLSSSPDKHTSRRRDACPRPPAPPLPAPARARARRPGRRPAVLFRGQSAVCACVSVHVCAFVCAGNGSVVRWAVCGICVYVCMDGRRSLALRAFLILDAMLCVCRDMVQATETAQREEQAVQHGEGEGEEQAEGEERAVEITEEGLASFSPSDMAGLGARGVTQRAGSIGGDGGVGGQQRKGKGGKKVAPSLSTATRTPGGVHYTPPSQTGGEDAALGSHIALIALSVFLGYLLNLSLKYLELNREFLRNHHLISVSECALSIYTYIRVCTSFSVSVLAACCPCVGRSAVCACCCAL